MGHIVKAYGSFFLKALVVLALLAVLFFAQDQEGNRGVLQIAGKHFETESPDYAGYRDFEAYGVSAARPAPVIVYEGGTLKVGSCKLTEVIWATDWTGSRLSVEVRSIRTEDGEDVTAGYHKETGEMEWSMPGIYVIEVSATDSNRKETTATFRVPVSRQEGSKQ